MIDQPELTFIFSIVALSVSVILLIITLMMRIKIKRILVGNSGDLGESLAETKRRLQNLEEYQRQTAGYLEILETRVSRSIQSTELLRFSPFTGIGRNGNQSFSASFINEEGDGIVVSGLYYSNDRVSLFAKPTKGFESEFDLTPEEKEVVSRSKKSLKSK